MICLFPQTSIGICRWWVQKIQSKIDFFQLFCANNSRFCASVVITTTATRLRVSETQRICLYKLFSMKISVSYAIENTDESRIDKFTFDTITRFRCALYSEFTQFVFFYFVDFCSIWFNVWFVCIKVLFSIRLLSHFIWNHCRRDRNTFSWCTVAYIKIAKLFLNFFSHIIL